MRFYRVGYSQQGGNHAGFSWHTSRREAERALAKAVADDPDEYRDHAYGADIDVITIVPTKAGILAALNRYADHADNG